MGEYHPIEHGAENVFQIQSSEQCICSVALYTRSHLQLNLVCRDEKGEAFYLTFGEVKYLQCPQSWKNANFRTTSEEECHELLLKAWNIRTIDFFPESLLRRYRLYTIETGTTQVKILAGDSEYNRKPFYYRPLFDTELMKRIAINSQTGEPEILATGTFKGAKVPHSFSITVAKILEHLEAGDSQQDILYAYSWLEPEDIQACLAYARRALTP